ncbi:MAG: exo-alpha-sialidase [Fimbriimonadaceae bacterium]|nr:exo-alpha-sialidase [Fimbriimonadaceae bacterium]
METALLVIGLFGLLFGVGGRHRASPTVPEERGGAGRVEATADPVLTTPMPLIPLGPFVRAANGDILAVNDGNVRRSTDQGASFKGSPMFPGGGVRPLNDSALLVTESGRVICYFIDRSSLTFEWDRSARAPSTTTKSNVYAATSDDHGVTWRLGSPLQTTYSGATRGLVEVGSGHIFAIGQEMTRSSARHNTVLFVSRDNGTTWRRSNVVDIGGRGDHDGIYEGVVATTGEGSALAVLRTNEDALYSIRYANGQWSRVSAMRVPSSSSPAGLLRLSTGELLMVYNPLYATGRNSAPRTSGQASERAASWYRRELYARLSTDGGETWGAPRILYESPRDVAYPSLFEVSPGVVWVTTYQGQARFSFRVTDLIAADPVR